MSVAPYDAAIVGAGVVGSAIARELTFAGLRCALIEAENDVGKGASKANSGILHTGFDAPVSSVEATLVARGHHLLGLYADEVGIATERVGAILIAWSKEEALRLPAVVERAQKNGYHAIRPLTPDEIYAREPQLGEGVVAGLEIPDEQIICPFTTTLALATEAVENGCHLRLDSRVRAIEPLHTAGYRLHLESAGVVEARLLVNAAGTASADVHGLVGRGGFAVRCRRGEFLVFDKLARPLVRHILLPVPTPASKGVLVAPTVYGNILVGPTSEDVERAADRDLTEPGLSFLLEWGARVLPTLLDYEVTAAYAGVRAASEPAGYQIGFDRKRGYVWAAGIRSTGVSAALAIAEWVRGQLPDSPSCDISRRRVAMPPIGEKQVRPFASAEAIRLDPECGRITCFCERVSVAEVRAALSATIPARDVDGLRRRTRALMGRCQGFFCGAAVADLVAQGTASSLREPVG